MGNNSTETLLDVAEGTGTVFVALGGGRFAKYVKGELVKVVGSKTFEEIMGFAEPFIISAAAFGSGVAANNMIRDLRGKPRITSKNGKSGVKNLGDTGFASFENCEDALNRQANTGNGKATKHDAPPKTNVPLEGDAPEAPLTIDDRPVSFRKDGKPYYMDNGGQVAEAKFKAAMKANFGSVEEAEEDDEPSALQGDEAQELHKRLNAQSEAIEHLMKANAQNGQNLQKLVNAIPGIAAGNGLAQNGQAGQSQNEQQAPEAPEKANGESAEEPALVVNGRPVGYDKNDEPYYLDGGGSVSKKDFQRAIEEEMAAA